jgi:hypothetical protein
MRNEESPFLAIARAPPIVNPHIAAIGPAQLLEPLHKRLEAGLPLRIARG